MRTRRLLVAIGAGVGLALTLPVALIAAPLLIVTRLTRLLGDRRHRRAAAVGWRSLVEYEPVIGWRPRADLDTYGTADDVFHLTTGPDGWRGTFPVEEADIVVVGDSFAFGHGADDGHMYSAHASGLRVKPIGSDGYDMVHGVLWMERLAPALTGKLVVWFVFYGNDLWENLLPTMGHYRKPFVRDTRGGSWTIVTDHVTPEPWPFPSPPRSYHQRLAEISTTGTRLSERAFSASHHLIERAESCCRAAGARLAVVGVPDRVQLTRRGRAKLEGLSPAGEQFDALLADRRLGSTCRHLALPFIPLSQHLGASDYLIQDIHWRPSGHRKVGAILAELHRHEVRVEVPA